MPPPQLKITIIGPVGCGKSTLLHGFIRGLEGAAAEAGLEVAWGAHPLVNLPIDAPIDANVKFETTEGRLTGYGAPYDLRITDSPGGSLTDTTTPFNSADPPDKWPELYQRTHDCDLMVLV